MIIVPGVVLLCAVLPFLLSFVVDAVVAVRRRGRAGVPALVAAVLAAATVAGLGVSIVLVNGQVPVTDAPGAAGLATLAGGLLLTCVPLSVVALVVRLWVGQGRRSRSLR
jgi:hypothetical protein